MTAILRDCCPEKRRNMDPNGYTWLDFDDEVDNAINARWRDTNEAWHKVWAIFRLICRILKKRGKLPDTADALCDPENGPAKIMYMYSAFPRAVSLTFRPEEATEICEELFALFPRDTELYDSFIYVYLDSLIRQNCWQDAYDIVQKMLDAGKDDVRLKEMHIRVLAGTGDFETGDRFYREYSALLPQGGFFLMHGLRSYCLARGNKTGAAELDRMISGKLEKAMDDIFSKFNGVAKGEAEEESRVQRERTARMIRLWQDDPCPETYDSAAKELSSLMQDNMLIYTDQTSMLDHEEVVLYTSVETAAQNGCHEPFAVLFDNIPNMMDRKHKRNMTVDPVHGRNGFMITLSNLRRYARAGTSGFPGSRYS